MNQDFLLNLFWSVFTEHLDGRNLSQFRKSETPKRGKMSGYNLRNKHKVTKK